MKMKNDLTGKRYGYLVVLEKSQPYIAPNGKPHITWLCKCDCGNKKIIQGRRLTEGHDKSCGCMKYDRGFNETREEGDTLYIKVGEQEVMIDKEDLHKIYPSKVDISVYGYALCKRGKRLHRVILDCPKGYEVDHINHNKLDNRKCNLRIVTRSENQMNKVITSNTGEYGISLCQNGRYLVRINQKFIGIKKTLEEAITIRDNALEGTKQLELNYYLSRKVAIND